MPTATAGRSPGRGGRSRGGVGQSVRSFAPRRFDDAPEASVLGLRAVVADRLRRRALGLMLLDPADAPAALLIPSCSSVHTFGMRFPIDVVFLDRGGRELGRRRVAPRRLAGGLGADSVLEIPVR